MTGEPLEGILPQTCPLKDGRVVLLRASDTTDAADLIEIERQVIEENIANVDDNLEGMAQKMAQRLEMVDPRSLWLVAEYEGQVVGSLGLRPYGPKYMDHLRVLGIELHREWRGNGLGSTMIRAAIAWARTSGVEGIFLRVLDSNPRARELYARLGFQQVGHIPRLIKRPDGSYSDDTEMMLWLGKDSPFPSLADT